MRRRERRAQLQRPTTTIARRKFDWFLVGLVILTFLIIGLLMHAAYTAGPVDQWGEADPVSREWFPKVMIPDLPAGQRPASCCGRADAYEADDFETGPDGTTIAILTCNGEHSCDYPCDLTAYSESTCSRVTRAPGTRFVVPSAKIQPNPPNPTGHGWVFLDGRGSVFCYCPPTGT